MSNEIVMLSGAAFRLAPPIGGLFVLLLLPNLHYNCPISAAVHVHCSDATFVKSYFYDLEITLKGHPWSKA